LRDNAHRLFVINNHLYYSQHHNLFFPPSVEEKKRFLSTIICMIHCITKTNLYSDEAKALGVEYCSMEEILTHSDIISLHLPLVPDTYHIIGLISISLSLSDSLSLVLTSPT